jgi:Bacterial Ig-like domain (group 2)
MRAQFSLSSTLCAAIAVFGACTSSPTGPAETKQPTLPPGTTLVLVVAPTRATIKSGHTLRLTATRKEAHGQSIAPAEVAWVSSNSKIARIGPDGTVVGAGLGAAEISARWNGMRGVSTVTVVSAGAAQGECPDLAIAAAGKPSPVPSKCRAD